MFPILSSKAVKANQSVLFKLSGSVDSLIQQSQEYIIRWREHEMITTISEPTIDFLTLWGTALTLRKIINFCNQKHLKYVIATVSPFLIVHPNFTVNWLGRELSMLGYVQRITINGWQNQRIRVSIISEIVSHNKFPEKCWQRPISESLLFATFDIFGHTQQFREKLTEMHNSSSTQKCYQRSSR